MSNYVLYALTVGEDPAVIVSVVTAADRVDAIALWRKTLIERGLHVLDAHGYLLALGPDHVLRMPPIGDKEMVHDLGQLEVKR